jgi:uncharacterized protein (TIGR02452 family)
MSLAGIAKDTLRIVECGSYRTPSGAEVSVRDTVDAAVRGTTLYRPAECDQLLRCASTHPPASCRIEVTDESTAEAGRRLVQTEDEASVVALNFASAKNPRRVRDLRPQRQGYDLARVPSALRRLLKVGL